MRLLLVTAIGSAWWSCGISIPVSPEQKRIKDINDNNKNQKLEYDAQHRFGKC